MTRSIYRTQTDSRNNFLSPTSCDAISTKSFDGKFEKRLNLPSNKSSRANTLNIRKIFQKVLKTCANQQMFHFLKARAN